ncbi:MAG: choice-of-anchor L domain-containing protein [Kofleriaceae bacterium]|nr:choice-of-anchor L domain-containing protein [Kofleriaceae bacterium]
MTMQQSRDLFAPSRLVLVACALSGYAFCGCGATGGGDSPDGGSDIVPEPIICTPGESQPCYSGPATSEGVGACTAGVQTCNAEGTALSGCVGEVLPLLEVCLNNVDDDCNGEVDDIADLDGDGFTRCDGDCCETTNECEQPALVNPAAVEVIAKDGMESGDENCNGVIDEVAPLCDQGLLLDEIDPVRAANALDICAQSSELGFGLVSAAYVRGNGSPLAASAQHGLQAAFGTNVTPQLGDSMLILSTGGARYAPQPDSCASETCEFNTGGSVPAGFPQDVPGCAGGSAIFDDVALKLTLIAPANAKGYAFDFRFYSYEYPEWVCTEFNDQFVALVEPPPPGAINGNIAFDSMTNPVSVNIGFFEVCEGCVSGTADLAGTGFDVLNDAGATSWLRTQAPITGGE